MITVINHQPARRPHPRRHAVTGPVSADGGLRPAAVSVALCAAIVVGSTVGLVTPTVSGFLDTMVDVAIVALVSLLFFTLRLNGLSSLRHGTRSAGLVLVIGFVVSPVLAIGLGTLLVADDALRVGVIIYCLFPCTDWFLGFTRMARGDTVTGAALIPVMLTLQLALYPVVIVVLGGESGGTVLGAAAPTLLTWFVLPAAIAVAVRIVARAWLSPATLDRVIASGDRLVVPVIAVLVVCLFGANVETVADHLAAFGRVLLVVAVFFVVIYLLGESVARRLHLDHDEHALVVVATSARNAPLMLALTTATLPDQPLVAAAIVLGMLVEFPHLIALTHLLRRRGSANSRAPTTSPEGVAAVAQPRE